MNERTSQDRSDKNNPNCNFALPPIYTPQDIAASNAITEIFNNPNLSKQARKDSAWDILKGS